MFHFRLRPLLRLRIAERDQRRADLAKALRAEEVLRSQEQRLADEQAEWMEQTRRVKAPGMADVDALLRLHRYQAVLAAQRQQLAGQLQQVLAEIERRRELLVEADRQVKVLEKLHQRQAAADRTEHERNDAKRLDEAATIHYLRRQEVLR